MTASEAPEGGESDSSSGLPPNRRSTFEPPAARFGEAIGADDDALAAALAEELNRATRTGSIPIQSPPMTYPEDAPAAGAPLVDEPVIDQPLVDEHVVEEPAAAQFAAGQPTMKPSAAQPAPPVGAEPFDASAGAGTPVWSLDDVPAGGVQEFDEPGFVDPPQFGETQLSETQFSESGAGEPRLEGSQLDPQSEGPQLGELQSSDNEPVSDGFGDPLVDDSALYESPVPIPQFDDPPVVPPADEAPVAENQAATPPMASPPPMAAPPPDGVPSAPVSPPVRQSLPDDALSQWIGDGATLEAIEQLEREASLRQEDAAAFREWEQSMLALGTPEALDAVDHARAGFSDVLAGSASAPSAPSAPSIATPPSSPEDLIDRPVMEQSAVNQPATDHLAVDDLAVHEPVVDHPVNDQAPLEHDDGSELNAEQLADLAVAPAPQSLPYSDIPPPPGEPGGAGWEGVDPATGGEVQDASVDGIPDLIEPSPEVGEQPDVTSVGSGFEEFLAETGLRELSPDSPERPEAGPADEGSPFPLAVYDEGEHVPETIDLQALRAFRVELAGLEPTPLEQRVGRSARLFWMWFAANSSIVSVGLGAVILSLGMSLRQAVIATLVGVCVSSLPLGIGALAGKRSGQPTMVVSRATFGLIGNILPALISLVTRVFWGAALLWLLALGVAAINESTGAVALEGSTLAIIGLAAGVVIVGVIAVFGYGLLARVQAVLTILSSVLVVAFIMLSWPSVDLRAAMRVGDGDWMLIATGAVLVFSVLGLAWAMSSSDVARYQHPHSSSKGTMLWSWAGVALPAFLLIGYGSLLAASDPELLAGLLERPLETLTALAPAPLVYGTLAVLAAGLLSGAVMTIYSGGFALQSMGLRAPRSIVTILVAVLTGAAAAGILLAVADFDSLVRDLATTVAVPVAGWVGVFSGELMLRGRRYHWESLVRRGGVYPDVRWVNLVTLIVASAIGYAFTNAAVEWLSWQGFGWALLGFGPDSVLASTDLGVVGALVLALLVTVVSARPAIAAQEREDQPTTESAPVVTAESGLEPAN